MAVRILGAAEVHRALVAVQSQIGEIRRIIPKMLDPDLHKYAHVITGYMKSTIYQKYGQAGADAYYAGFEADRGGEHDFAQQAIDDFDWEELFDKIVEPY